MKSTFYTARLLEPSPGSKPSRLQPRRDRAPDWKSAQETTTISFSGSTAGRFSYWHTVPRRQFVIILSGQLEIGLGDGSKHVSGPGDARLVEDITGQGHTTATHGDQACVTYTISLAYQ